jgi:hypothetical protein
VYAPVPGVCVSVWLPSSARLEPSLSLTPVHMRVCMGVCACVRAGLQLVPTSKKPAEARRSELLAAVRGPLMDALLRHATLYARNKFGAEVGGPLGWVGHWAARLQLIGKPRFRPHTIFFCAHVGFWEKIGPPNPALG